MSDTICPIDGGKLLLDFEETKRNGLLPVYSCDNCGRGYILQQVSQKTNGWKTKRTLESRELQKQIPF